MYNKTWLILVAALVLVLSLLPACRAEAPTPAPAPMTTYPEMTLKFATWLAMDHPSALSSYIRQADLITERTDGAVTFEWYPLAQLFKPTEAIASVGAGVADLSILVFTYEAGRVPLGSVEGLPFAFETPEQVLEVYRRGWDMLQAEVAPFNVKLLSYNAAQPHVLCTKDKPVRTIDDVKGLKIRGAGGLEDMMLEAIGAIPVTMSSADVYLAIQTGVLDGGCSLPTSPDAHPWGDLVKYMMLTNHMYVAGATMINLDTWNNLPPEVQEIMLEASRDMEDYNIAYLDQMFEESVGEWSSLPGKEVIEFSEVERMKWKELSAPIWDDWVSICEEAGKGDEARQLLTIIEDVTG